MFRKKANKPQNRIDSLIGAGTRIEGNVTFAGGLRVDGEIKGNVVASGDQPSTLVVSEQARIDGEIHVSHLVVNGAINGPVHSAEFLELQDHCRVNRGCALQYAGNAPRSGRGRPVGAQFQRDRKRQDG